MSATYDRLDLIEDKTEDGENLLAGVRRATQTDFPNWSDALNNAHDLIQTVNTLVHSLVDAAWRDGTTSVQIAQWLRVKDGAQCPLSGVTITLHN